MTNQYVIINEGIGGAAIIFQGRVIKRCVSRSRAWYYVAKYGRFAQQLARG